MDRFDPPSLFVPVVLSLIAALFLTIGYKGEWMPDMLRALCVFFGFIFALAAAATAANWLLYQIAEHAKRLSDARPQVRYAALVAHMSLEQLDALTLISPFLVDARLQTSNGAVELVKNLECREGKIPYWWLEEFMSKCAEEYPYIPPQHGEPDNTNRQYVRWLTRLMVDNEMATAPAGNKAAQWRFPLGNIMKLLELE